MTATKAKRDSVATSTDTVSVDRAELEAILDSLGGWGAFLDKVYAGGALESPLWKETLGIQKRLRAAAGMPSIGDLDDDAAEAVYRREDACENAYLARHFSQWGTVHDLLDDLDDAVESLEATVTTVIQGGRDAG